MSKNDFSGICLGRNWIDNVVDINDISRTAIKCDSKVLERLLEISLFDIWLANEDRTSNNLNIIYDKSRSLVFPIDHAGIFNTSFSTHLSQLDFCESLLYSNIVGRLYKMYSSEMDMDRLNSRFKENIQICMKISNEMITELPIEWHIQSKRVEGIMQMIFSNEWIECTWKNFCSMLKKIQ